LASKKGGGFLKGVAYGAVAEIVFSVVLVGIFHKLSGNIKGQ
jgi:hypothetical protein